MDLNQKYLIDTNDVKNVVTKDGNRIGFEFKMLIPYYRGVALSMVDDLYVKADEKLFAKETLTFTVDGHSYTWPQIEPVTTLRWEYGAKATVFVPLEGGLMPSPMRRLEVGCAIRMSYGPGPLPCVVRHVVDSCKLATVEY